MEGAGSISRFTWLKQFGGSELLTSRRHGGAAWPHTLGPLHGSGAPCSSMLGSSVRHSFISAGHRYMLWPVVAGGSGSSIPGRQAGL